MSLLSFDTATDYFLLTFVTVGLMCMIGVIVSKLLTSSAKPFSQLKSFESCKSPDCFRCAKVKDVLNVSFQRFLQYSRKTVTVNPADENMGLDRIKQSFHESLLTENSTDMTEMETIAHNQSYMLQQHSQKPVIFSLLGLKSEPFWDGVLKDDILKLEKNYEIIMDEFNAIFYHGKASDGWAMNSTPTGTWSIFCFINQGSVIPQNAELCPKTWQIVQSLQNLMTDCVFGNVAFSVIYRGTKITEHYGPTNIRLRCHLALQAPSSGSLTVNGISKKWKEGKCLLFDDSFLHSVEYNKASLRTESAPDGHSVLSSKASPDLTAETGNQDECTGEENACIRSILMLDFWHPGLTDKERKALGYSFSTLGTCVES